MAEGRISRRKCKSGHQGAVKVAANFMIMTGEIQEEGAGLRPSS
jgi:hypothetical protein